MNKVITSKEAILKSAKDIAYRDGIYKINIRAVASECGISIGSIYNYFPTKDDLVVAVIEDFWKNIFARGMCDHQSNLCFVQFYEQLYLRFYDYLKIFKEDMFNQISFFSEEVKGKGRSKESQYFDRVKQVMLYHLEMDEGIKKHVWNEYFTKERFVTFAFENMIIMLRGNEGDISFFKEIIMKLLY
ncbi:MAG: TetR/AcrR family transcriptional regulator [Clostridium sp.]|nr:TetR/AcrR family transcriptional regulator [Clostridium sp.]MDU7083526.1 TetR/AcrR family transcriptional regulator [Clostridium sp.]